MNQSASNSKDNLSARFDAAATVSEKAAVVTRKVFKGAAWSLLASTGLATVLQFAPGLVSQTTQDYMHDHGYDTTQLDQFKAADTRVYERGNPLVPFHMAGHSVRRMWSQEGNALIKSFVAPFALHDGFTTGIERMRSDSRLAAYSSSTAHDNPADRNVFITPSDATTPPTQWLREMTGIKVEHLDFGRHSEAEMTKMLAEYVFFHELRHGDQSKDDNRTLKESDADNYSLHVAALGGSAPSLVGETRIFVMALRTISATLHGESSHATALSLRRGMDDDFVRDDPLHNYSLQHRGHSDGSAFVAAHLTLRSVIFDTEEISSSVDKASAYYHAASALLDAGIAQRDNEEDPIALYVQAMDYLDAISGGKVIDRSVDHTKIDVSAFIHPVAPEHTEHEQAPLPVAASHRSAPKPAV